MKSDEARDLISGIGDSFISEAMPERFRRHRTRRGWIAATACFAVIVGIIGGALYGAALRLPDIEGRLEQKKITDTIGISAVTAPAIVFDCPGVKYRSSYYLGQTEPTSADAIGNRLDTALSESGEEIGIYRINGYSSDYAIALRRDGDANAALYINAGYAPATLGGLLRDTGLDRTPAPFITSAYYLYKGADGAQHTAEFEEAVFGHRHKNACRRDRSRRNAHHIRRAVGARKPKSSIPDNRGRTRYGHASGRSHCIQYRQAARSQSCKVYSPKF